MNNIDTITQYVLSITPAATAVISTIVVLFVGIAKIKTAFSETDRSNKQVLREVREMSEENRDLRKALAAQMRQNAKLEKKLSHLSFSEEPEDGAGE